MPGRTASGRVPLKMHARWLLLAGASVLVSACNSDSPVGAADNRAPSFVSTPIKSAEHNRAYSYTVDVADPDGDSVSVTAPVLPRWMTFNGATRTLSGTAGWDNLGSFPVSVAASDGEETVTQPFSINVVRGEIVCNQEFGSPDSSAYRLPFSVGRSYRVIQSYCPANPAWGHHNWFAYDFDMAIGDTVLASRSGTVFAVVEGNANGTDCSGGKENFVFVAHDDGTAMQYVHLTTNGALVSRQERVAQGQPIGLSGNSGCSSGPHLHVALFRSLTNFDRQSTLPFNYRNAVGALDVNHGLLQNGQYTAN